MRHSNTIMRRAATRGRRQLQEPPQKNRIQKSILIQTNTIGNKHLLVLSTLSYVSTPPIPLYAIQEPRKKTRGCIGDKAQNEASDERRDVCEMLNYACKVKALILCRHRQQSLQTLEKHHESRRHPEGSYQHYGYSSSTTLKTENCSTKKRSRPSGSFTRTVCGHEGCRSLSNISFVDYRFRSYRKLITVITKY